MKNIARVLVLLASVRVLMAQGVTATQMTPSILNPGSSRSNSDLILHTWAVTGHVKTIDGDPVGDVNVLVKVLNYMGKIASLRTDIQGEFHTEFQLSSEMVKDFGVELTATKKGFMKTHALVDFGDSGKTWVLTVTLRNSDPDPNLLSPDSLIASLTPNLKELSSADGLSEKSVKEYEKGVTEFLVKKDAERALWSFMKVVQHDGTCPGCLTMLGLAELATGDWDGAEHNFSTAVNGIKDKPEIGRPEPLIAYGVMQGWRHETSSSAGYLLEAIRFAPHDALALQELGRTQVMLRNWEAAKQRLQQALAAGAGPDARLLEVQALLGTDDCVAADKELDKYLVSQNSRKLSARIMQLQTEVKGRLKAQETARRKSDVDRPLGEMIGDFPELKGLEPAADQTSLGDILKAVGENVAASFRNFPNTVSVEQVHQDKLQNSGKVEEKQDQQFRYLCLTSPEPSGPGFSEYRADKFGTPAIQKGLQQGFMLTSGFTSAALMFHPLYQSDATFRYLGRQRMEGRDCYVISYAQRPGKARLTGAFKVNGALSITFTQGLAWVDDDTHQIIRLRTDLLTPLPEVHLERQTTDIEFGAVHFKKISQEFWLPQRVTVAVDWNGRHLRNEHEYSDFQLFNVNAAEKDKERKTPSQPAKDNSTTGLTP